MNKMLISKFCFNKEYLKYEIVTDVFLAKDIIFICNLLNKGIYIIEMFAKDPLNSIICVNANISIKNKNFVYHFCNDIQYLSQTDFTKARFFCICTTELSKQISLTHAGIVSKSSFTLCWDNYIETAELIVQKSAFSDSILTTLSNCVL